MSQVLQNASREHSAILLTFIKIQFAIKTFVLSIFEWPLKTGLTVVLLMRSWLLYFGCVFALVGEHVLMYVSTTTESRMKIWPVEYI